MTDMRVRQRRPMQLVCAWLAEESTMADVETWAVETTTGVYGYLSEQHAREHFYRCMGERVRCKLFHNGVEVGSFMPGTAVPHG